MAQAGSAAIDWPEAHSADSTAQQVHNNIFWANSPTQILEGALGKLDVRSSDVQGGWSGAGNINAEPVFVDAPSAGNDGVWGTPDDDYGDLRLAETSPCLDQGDAGLLPVDDADLDEDQVFAERLPLDGRDVMRVLGCALDMGAFEYFTDCNDNGVPDADDMGDISVASARFTRNDIKAIPGSMAVDGDIALVGTPDTYAVGELWAGMVSTYRRDPQTGEWTLDMSLDLLSPNPTQNGGFGRSVALEDGWAVVGEPQGEDQVHFYSWSGQAWQLIQSFDEVSTLTGTGVDIDMEAGVAIVGSWDDAYIYRFNGTTWSKEQELSLPVPDPSTTRVAIHGDVAVIGFRPATVNGLYGAGEAYLFRYDGDSWDLTDTLHADVPRENAAFGFSVDTDGCFVVVGAFREDVVPWGDTGAAYVFGTDATPLARLTGSDASYGAWFGHSVAIDGDVIAVGAPQPYHDGAGALYVFRNGLEGWTEIKKVTASNASNDDEFGSVLAVSGLRVLASADSDHYGPDGVGSFYVHELRPLGDANADGILDECQMSLTLPEAVVEVGPPKNRFLAFDVPAAGDHAIRVRFTSLHDPAPLNAPENPAPDYWEASGQVRWVGPVSTCTDESKQTTYKCAPLTSSPLYTNWDEGLVGETLYVYGTSIVPDSVYEVEVVAAECEGNEGSCAAVSPPVQIRTARWGDLVEPFQDRDETNPTQPNVLDISAAADALKGEPAALGEPFAMVQPCSPDPVAVGLSVLDISWVVDAVSGEAYPFKLLVCD